MPDDIARQIDDAPRAHLVSQAHCHACLKVVLNQKELANFVIIFWEGFDPSGEPIIKDGVFDDRGRIAILKSCESCGPKIKKMHRDYTKHGRRNCYAVLNDGPLKKMMDEIWPRRKATWHFEIGWQLLLPILQQIKAEKIAASKVH